MNNKLYAYLEKTISRSDYLKDFDSFVFSPFIKILVWARRVGKSYFLYQVIKKLLEQKVFDENHIFYVNKEWLEFDEITDYKSLYKLFLDWKRESKVWDKFFVWIDEVQEIETWQKFILSVWSEYPESIIFITWSNSKLLSKDIWTQLRWRYISKRIFPLTLKEFLEFKKIELSDEVFNEYIKFWWLPATTFIDDESIKSEYLKWVYNTIFVKDLLEYEKIRNPNLLKTIHKFLFKEIWNLINGKNIVNYLKSQWVKTSVETVLNYIEFSQNAFLFDEVLRYDIRWKKIFETTKKYYSFDLWVRNAIVGINLKNDIWWIYENLVYNYLKVKGYDVYVGVFYDKEIDFIAEKNWEKIYIQVAYLLPDEDTIQREFWNLLKIRDGRRKIVISWDKFPIKKYEGIEHINIVDFLQMDL